MECRMKRLHYMELSAYKLLPMSIVTEIVGSGQTCSNILFSIIFIFL